MSPQLGDASGGANLLFTDGRAAQLELYAHRDTFPETLSSWTLD